MPVAPVVLLVIASIPASVVAETGSAPDSSVTEQPGNTLIPFPFFIYTPETKTGGGVALTYTTRSGEMAGERPSTYDAFVLYTQRSQYSLSLGLDRYTADERDQITAGVSFSKFPSTFFGLGPETDRNVSEDYTSRNISLTASVKRSFRPGWRTGPSFVFSREKVKDLEASGMLASGDISGSAGGYLVAPGWAVSHDTRDNIFYPSRGLYHSYTLAVSEDFLGSDFRYMSQTLDLRQYLSGGGAIFAVRVLARNMSAEPPFQVLPGLGGVELLRGYYEGRFRDRNLLAMQAECRVGHWKRMGLVLFAGAGQVAREPGDFRADRIRSVYGLGLRVLLSRVEKIHLRADFGRTDEGGSGFYLGMLEAF